MGTKHTPSSKTRSGSLSEVQNLLDSTRTEILLELKGIKDFLTSLDSKIRSVECTLRKVLDTQKQHDSELTKMKGDILSLKEEQSAIFDEMEERDRRKTNLILSGLPERSDGSVEERKKWDAEKVKSLFNSLSGLHHGTLASTFRIGKINSGKPRLLRVVCRDVDTKRALLQKAKDLRNMSDYKHVFINPDLTPVQQKADKLLREELKRRRASGEDVIIRRGKIVNRNLSS